MSQERPGHTLQTMALVNEVYVRLIDGSRVNLRNRAHFFALSAQVMRRILLDFARRRQNVKRGGAARRVSFDEAVAVCPEPRQDLVAIDDALKALQALNRRQSEVVELRFFGGLSAEETAEALNVSVGAVRCDWTLARAWLHIELSGRTDQ